MQQQSPITAKTVRLARGKHVGPEQGACVMEVASMLEGAAFGDRPPSASPVIGALLRSVNDVLGDDARQALLAYATRVVGSRGSVQLERQRMARLLDALAEAHARRPALHRALSAPPRYALPLGPTDLEHAAMCFVRLHHGRRRPVTGSSPVLALVDELLTMGRGVRVSRRPDRPAARPVARR